MQLSKFIAKLQELEAAGHGDLLVIYRDGASGACGPLGSPRVTAERDEYGPFEPAKGEYVSVYAGH